MFYFKPFAVSLSFGLILVCVCADAGSFPFRSIQKVATYGEIYEFGVNDSVSYAFAYSDYEDVTNLEPPRVTIGSLDANASCPILVSVSHRENIVAWKLPLAKTKRNRYDFQNTSRTLCLKSEDGHENVVVSVSSPCPTNLNFRLTVQRQQNFSIKLDEERDINITASEPIFFFYKFDENVSTVVLEIESLDTKCMTLSIQNKSCPVYDIEQTVEYRGSWETITTRGGIMLKREHYPEGLYVVLNVHGDDSDCTDNIIEGEEAPPSETDRSKTLKLTMRSTLSRNDYVIAAAAMIIAILAIYIVAGLIFYCKCKQKTTTTAGIELESNQNASIPPVDRSHCVHSNADVLRKTSCLYLSDLATQPPQVLQSRSEQYGWNLITFFLFYFLPVFQLVYTDQKVLNVSGNQDLCFYNFLCSHRYLEISDFNHVLSNLGYLLLGGFFLFLTYCKQRNSDLNSGRGVPHHFGLYYAMGGALMMEGVLSACYHVCPSYSNIQFDTTFMFVMTMLGMLKIYQSRHPDINASATFAYLFFAAVPSLAVWGVLGPSFWFYLIFDVLHILTCWFLSLQIFYMGHWKLAFTGPKGTFAEFLRKPFFKGRLRLLLLGNAINIYLAYDLLRPCKEDFTEHLLKIFIWNLILYMLFYIIMKIRTDGETIKWKPVLYLLISIVCWIFARRHYKNSAMSWLETPAQSRTHNTPCKILGYYDNHDIWHMCSAAGLFFSYMVLLTVDDDLQETERTEIVVF